MPLGHLASCALLQAPRKFTHSCNIRSGTHGIKAASSEPTKRVRASKAPLLYTSELDPVTELGSPPSANSQGRRFSFLTPSAPVTFHLVFVLN